jgi:hypothetical protein
MHPIEIRKLTNPDAANWWRLRLEALDREPRALLVDGRYVDEDYYVSGLLWGGQFCPQPAFSRLWPPKRRLRPRLLPILV